MTCLLETCRIAPPHSAEERLLPLTFFDIIWLPFLPIRRLLFYEFPCSKEHFLEALVPKLKESLSVALKHYFPLAGSFVCPLDAEKQPAIRVLPGDSVSLTFVESNGDFGRLVGDHARDADQFYEFIPHLPPISEESNAKAFQVLAIQVTLFPGHGFCIGLTNHHVVGDASSIIGFIKTWAEICKHGGDDEFVISEGRPLPLYDRSMVKDPSGAFSFYWNQMRQIPFQPEDFPLPTNRVRATYVLGQCQIKKFKELLLARKPGLTHVSSFVVTAAYVWTCLVKSLVASDQEIFDDGAEAFFLFAVDSRARLDPPLPENYFGNCLAYGMAGRRRRDLAGDEGFLTAAEAIAMEIQTRVDDKKKLMTGVENWGAEISAARNKGMLSVSGSARVDLYNTDFGWGKMRKLEMLSIDGEKYSMSLCRARESNGGLETGLSLPKDVMNAFAAAFADGLEG